MHSLGQADPVTQAVLVQTLHTSTDESECPNTGTKPVHSELGQPTGKLATVIAGSETLDSDQELGEHVVSSQLGVCNLRVELGTNYVPSHPSSQPIKSRLTASSHDRNCEHGTDKVPSQSKPVVRGSPGRSAACQATGTSALPLDPHATPFVASSRILGGLLPVDKHVDLEHVLQVQAGGVGRLDHGGQDLWEAEVVHGSRPKGERALQQSTMELPFAGVDDIPDMLGTAPKDIHEVGRLPDLRVTLPVGDFCDKVLPAPSHSLKVNEVFTPDYFVALHNITASAGMRTDGSMYGEFTPNHLGARISLPHTKLRLERWRFHLQGYDKVEICQLLEFGFPIGIDLDQELECKIRNHGSSYMWYTHIDKFLTKESEALTLYLHGRTL